MSYFHTIKQVYKKHIRGQDKEARFFVLVSFTITFILVRLTVYGIKYHFLPSALFGDVRVHDLHVHHLVFGIILLLIAGVVRIPRLDDNHIHLSSIMYGIGAALTLDEFSLWLRLDPDAYFGAQGRISIDAVVLFLLLLISTILFGSFWSRVFHNTVTHFVFRRRPWYTKFKRALLGHKILCVIALMMWSFFLGEMVFYYVVSQVAIAQVPYQNPKQLVSLVRVDFSKTPRAMSTPIDSIASRPFSSVSNIKIIAQIEATQTANKDDFCLHVPVLMYHHIEPWAEAVVKKHTSLAVDTNTFDEQMGYLASQGYHTISADQLVSALHDHVSLLPKSVVLTFDDAYLDNYTYAYPTLKKYHLVGNYAVPTGLLGIHADTNDYYTWDQLKEMVDSEVIYANDHSWSHYPVGTGSLEKNQFEILTSKNQLESFLGKKITTFIYPYGSYQPWVFNVLQKDGFEGAFTTKPGTLQCESFVMNLHRNRVGNGQLTMFGI